MQKYAPKNTQMLKFGFEFWIFLVFEFEYFANLLQISKKIIKKIKKNLFYGFEYQFEKLEKKSKLLLKSILEKFIYFLLF